MSILFLTDKLILLLQVLFELPKPSAQVSLRKCYLYSKYEAKRCVFDYSMNCFRVYNPIPPLCSTPMPGILTGELMGPLKVLYGEFKQLTYSLNDPDLLPEDENLYMYSREEQLLALCFTLRHDQCPRHGTSVEKCVRSRSPALEEFG